jgi:aspartate racemase
MTEAPGVPDGSARIGLVGGLALRAGVFYYERLLQRHAAEGRRLDLVLAHADVATVLAHVAAGDKAGLGRYLGDVANRLFDAGAGLVAIGAVAPHLAADEIASVARGPMVSVLDLIGAGIAAAGIKRVAVFGNRAVMETDVFGCLPPPMVVRHGAAQLDSIHAAYTDVAVNGKRGTAPEAAFFAAAARRAMEEGGAEAILLAGTDLSSFYADEPPPFPAIDVAALHVEAIVQRAWTAAPA